MDINRILFGQLSENKGIEKAFEDYDVNNDGIINEKDAANANSELAEEIKSLLNSADTEPEIILTDKKTDVPIFELSDSELESKISELKKSIGKTFNSFNVQYGRGTEAEQEYFDLINERSKRNQKKYSSNADIEKADRFMQGAWSWDVMTFNLSELEYIVSKRFNLNQRPIHLNYQEIKKEPNWESRLAAALEGANVILWTRFNIEEEINKVKTSTDNPQDKIEGVMKKTYTHVVDYLMDGCGMDTKKIPMDAYLRYLSEMDFNGDGQIDFCDLNMIPDEMDCNGDGCINNEEKALLKEIKFTMYDYITRLTKVSMASSNSSSKPLNVDINQLIARAEFLVKNPQIKACEEDFYNLYSTVYDTFGLAAEMGKLQKKYQTSAEMAPAPNTAGLSLVVCATTDFKNKNGKAPSEEGTNYIKEYFYQRNNIAKIFASYIDDKSLSKAELQDILSRITAVNNSSVQQELEEIKEEIKKRIDNYEK